MKANVISRTHCVGFTWERVNAGKSQITNPKSQKNYNDSNSNIQTV
jgi:hypothetical protein